MFSFGKHNEVPYFLQVTVQATCITLAVLSIDRYCAIVHPLRSIDFRTPKVAAIVSACTWIGSFLLALPLGLNIQLEEVENFGPQLICREHWPTKSAHRSYMLYTFLITYVIPLVFCTFSCSFIVRKLLTRFSISHAQKTDAQARQTRRTSCMVIGVVVLFAFCWLPNHIINLWFVFNPEPPKVITDVLAWTKTIALILCYSNSMLNPFVYTLLGENYRRCLRQSFPWLFKKRILRRSALATGRSSSSSRPGKTTEITLRSSAARPVIVTFNNKRPPSRAMTFGSIEEEHRT
ncbi:receptor [Branchiostoma belcheri]|nr:receptor [Branchiostoma belcheri]